MSQADSSRPLVTAAIPVYNHEHFVVKSIQSIIEQDYPSIELIVINDGSGDRSHEKVQSLSHQCEKRFARFTYINRENRGLTATLNQALSLACGKYFAASASDDVMLPDKFSRLVKILESRDERYAAAFGDAAFIDENGVNVFKDKDGMLRTRPTQGTWGTWVTYCLRSGRFGAKSEVGDYRRLLRVNSLPAPSSLVKTDYIKRVGGWTEGNLIEDWELWLSLAREYSIVFVDEIVSLYRVHPNCISIAKRQEMMKLELELVKREKDYCVRENMMTEWEDSFFSHIYWLLRYGGLPVREWIETLASSRPLALLGYLGMEAFRRVHVKKPSFPLLRA